MNKTNLEKLIKEINELFCPDPLDCYLTVEFGCWNESNKQHCNLWVNENINSENNQFNKLPSVSGETLNECIIKLTDAFNKYKKQLNPEIITHNGKQYKLIEEEIK